MFIYDNLCKEEGITKLAAKFPDSFKVGDYGDEIPHKGVFFGGIAGANWIQANRPNVKVWANFKNFLCSAYYPKIGKYLFNDKYAFVPFKDVPRRKWDLYSWLGKEALIFIRPDSGEKDFPATLIDLQDIDKFVADYPYEGMAVISTPKNSIGEWRIVVSPEGVEAFSLYKYQGLLTTIPSSPPGAIQLAEKINEIYRPDELFCVDIVEDMGQDFHVMELTSLSSAGLYACDVDKLADLIKKYS